MKSLKVFLFCILLIGGLLSSLKAIESRGTISYVDYTNSTQKIDSLDLVKLECSILEMTQKYKEGITNALKQVGTTVNVNRESYNNI